MNVSKEMIVQARATNLVEFLRSRGVVLKAVGGGNYMLSEHDSLRIKENMFNWFSRGLSGTAIDFVMLYYNLSFVDSVLMLCGSNVPIVYSNAEINVNKPVNIFFSADKKRVIAYLCKTRGIDYNIIKPLILNDIIRQDIHNNVVFCGANGFEISGTLSGVKYKKIVGHYDGFRIVVGIPFKALVFESSIDLLSYYQLKKNNIVNAILVSMGGLKHSIIDNIVKEYHLNFNDVYICTDRDNPSKEFILRCLDNYKGIKYVVCPCHDWNDFLLSL